MKSDDVDLQIIRLKHGWSCARLSINGIPHEFTMTHIFADPLESIAITALELNPAIERTSFDWRDEPGCDRWSFERTREDHHLFAVTVGSYDAYQPTKHEEPTALVEFTVEYRFWKVLVCAELARTEMLLRHSPFRDDRRPDTFPHRAFRELERQIKDLCGPSGLANKADCAKP